MRLLNFVRGLGCSSFLFVLALAAGACAGAAAPPANPGQPRCMLGADGVQACGYKCMLGADGHAACANSPDGVCALGSDGHATCSQVASAGGPPPGAPPPECRMSSDGTNVCGYNCRYASSGHVSCASRPDAQCAFNSDGSLTCP